MSRWLPIVAFLAVVTSVGGAVQAREKDETQTKPEFSGEVLFAAQKISLLVDRDIIPVRPKIGKFDKVRFRALGRDVFVHDLKVVYADGTSKSLMSDQRLRQDRKSDWVSLRPAGFIEEFRVIYRPYPKRNHTARIEAFGEYADGWLESEGDGRKHNDGWVLVGTDTAGMRGNGRVTIKVGENDGYKKLRIAVNGNDVRMRYLTVVYEDGSKDDVTERRRRVRAGESVGPFELEKDVAIKEIRGRWTAPQSSRRHRRYATVQVWGHH